MSTVDEAWAALTNDIETYNSRSFSFEGIVARHRPIIEGAIRASEPPNFIGECRIPQGHQHVFAGPHRFNEALRASEPLDLTTRTMLDAAIRARSLALTAENQRLRVTLLRIFDVSADRPAVREAITAALGESQP